MRNRTVPKADRTGQGGAGNGTTDDMRHPSAKALFAYWLRLKGGRTAPSRGEVDPRALAAHLGDILLLDGADNGHALRLAGSRMEAEIGAALVGTPFGALFNEETRREALQALSNVTMEGQPMLLGIRLDLPEQTRPNTPASNPTIRPEVGQWVRPHWNNLRWPDLPQGQTERRSARPGSGELLLLPLEHRGVIGARVLGAFGLNTPSAQLPAQRLTLRLTGERMLGPGALALKGQGLTSGATLVSRKGVVQLFRGIDLPPQPQNDG